MNNKTTVTHGEKLQELKDLLYSEDNSKIITEIINKNPLDLHILAANYNWNSGFEVPKAILSNENCDFGTGLLMFYRADGYRPLRVNGKSSSQSYMKEYLITTSLISRFLLLHH